MAASRLGHDALPFGAGNTLAEHLDQEVADVLVPLRRTKRGFQAPQLSLQTRDAGPRVGLLQ
ncbi:hypothetical protein VZ52_03050 [Ralstonia mannitolilytica]|nr:hypothetical protein VZ52_03050 [Ralstonia mannitolilytica]